MQLRIKKDTRFKDKVCAKQIHGKFPYKLYLQVKGNCLYGQYIVVVSNKQLDGSGKIDSVIIQLVDKISMRAEQDILTNNVGSRPNSINGDIMKYSVNQVNILNVGDAKMHVFIPA